MQKKGSKILVLVLVVLLVLFLLLKFVIRPAGLFGVKKITIQINTDEFNKTFSVKSDADNLADVLLENNLVEGEIGEYGLYIHAAGGRAADPAKEEWWGIYQTGEMLMSGASDTPVANGDSFELVLETGYDY